jgi:hypothetical protein
VAFWEERALPAGVLGPVECLALRRLAASCFGEMGHDLFLWLRGVVVLWTSVSCNYRMSMAQWGPGTRARPRLCLLAFRSGLWP